MAKAVISDKTKVKSKTIKPKNYSITKIVHPNRIVRINETLPFRVKFINIGVESYGSNNVPGIGIQVIGYSNYIL
jgi:hypothetical protein